jgi:hypothetical protein
VRAGSKVAELLHKLNGIAEFAVGLAPVPVVEARFVEDMIGGQRCPRPPALLMMHPAPPSFRRPLRDPAATALGGPAGRCIVARVFLIYDAEMTEVIGGPNEDEDEVAAIKEMATELARQIRLAKLNISFATAFGMHTSSASVGGSGRVAAELQVAKKLGRCRPSPPQPPATPGSPRKSPPQPPATPGSTRAAEKKTS